jgi:hypothetical protein
MDLSTSPNKMFLKRLFKEEVVTKGKYLNIYTIASNNWINIVLTKRTSFDFTATETWIMNKTMEERRDMLKIKLLWEAKSKQGVTFRPVECVQCFLLAVAHTCCRSLLISLSHADIDTVPCVRCMANWAFAVV